MQYMQGSGIDLEASMLFQMTVLKCLTIRESLKKVSYKSKDGSIEMGPMFDPFSMWPLVRCQYEAFCAFNHIFINPKTEEEKGILYRLWVISGLKYRQEFDAGIQDNVDKQADELKRINKYEEEIQQTNFYLNLIPREQEKLKKAIKNKEWQFYNDNGIIKFASWKKMASNADVDPKLFKDTYSYLSLGAHPSNVSVFQFKELYRLKADEEIDFFSLNLSRQIIAFLIRDYCIYNKVAANIIFNGLDITNQVLVNMINKSFRGNAYSINGIEKTV